MKREIKNLKTKTSALGMGCWAIGGEWDFFGTPAGWGKTDDAESIRTIQAAYDHGIRLFDTAATYGTGHSEHLVGRALGSKIKDCIIVTKFGFNVNVQKQQVWAYGDNQVDSDVLSHLKQDCEASLKRLGTDVIDVFLLHIWDYHINLAKELQPALEELVTEGKIKSYGWSTDDLDSIKLWSGGNHYSAIMNNFHVAADAPELMNECEKQGLTALNRGPLAMGYLTGKYSLESKFADTDVRAAQWVTDGFGKPVLSKLDQLREVLTSDGRSLTQGALAWIWAKSGAALPTPGIRTAAQAIENAKAMEFGPLTESQLRQVEEIMGRF